MPMMMAVLVVIAKHSTTISVGEEVVDEGQVIANYFAGGIMPNFFTDKTRPAYTSNRRYFVDDLPQLSLRGHKPSLSQLGH